MDDWSRGRKRGCVLHQGGELLTRIIGLIATLVITNTAKAHLVSVAAGTAGEVGKDLPIRDMMLDQFGEMDVTKTGGAPTQRHHRQSLSQRRDYNRNGLMTATGDLHWCSTAQARGVYK